MFGTLGVPELLIIGCIALLIFGPSRLPKMGRALGDTLREMKNAGKELTSNFEDAAKDEPIIHRRVSTIHDDVVSALVNLGHRRADATATVTYVLARTPGLSFEETFKTSIRELTPSAKA